MKNIFIGFTKGWIMRSFFMSFCYVGLLSANTLLSPSDFLGYKLGDQFTPHHRVIDYLNHVSINESNVKIVNYGKTYENRSLALAIISNIENMDRLDQLREDNLKRAGIINGAPRSGKIGIVWLSYNVHGNEANSTEAAMKTLYALADKSNARTQKWLQNTIVIIDPSINPDGRDRYANWYRMTGNRWPDADPLSREHMEPWPGGRTNHYYFDLNRDWAWQTQIESQQRISVYNQWLPHIHVDFHEQSINNPYFFAPAAQPLHQYITKWQRDFQKTIGLNHIKYFDKNNWLYFTKESFDLLYPSYGDTYPTYNGAIGMTYEQAGHSRGGLAVETEDGDTLTLADRLEHHFTTGLSTVEVASNNMEKMVDEFKKFFNPNRKELLDTYQSYVILRSNPLDKLNHLKSWLDKNGIEHQTSEESRSFRGFNYSNGITDLVKVKKGDLVVSSKQPKSILVQVLFEPKTFLADTMTYDITAWSIPYVYGLKAYAIKNPIKTVKSQRYFSNRESLDGKPYAYILPWQGIDDLRFLSELFKNNIVTRVSLEPFDIKGKSFDRGTLVITRKGNEELGDIFDLVVKKAANKYNRPLVSASSGFVSKGKDFGSSSMRVVKKPKIGLISGEGVSSYNFGEIWHFFERQIEFPVTVVGTNYFSQMPKHDFDVLIFPSGSHSYIDDNLRDELRIWVRAGGRMILMDGAINSFVSQNGYGLKKFANDEEKKSIDEKNQSTIMSERLNLYKDRQRNDLSQNAYGAIVKLRMDNSHPLAFGYNNEYLSLKLRNRRFAYLESGWNVGTTQDSTSIISGFVGYKAKNNFREAMVFGVEDIGRGNIVYLVDNPLFRGFWYNGKLLFGNAVFLVGS